MKRICRNGADVISDWNDVGFTVDRTMPPPVAERLIAVVQVAMLGAVSSIDRKYRPYLAQLRQKVSREAATATAYANLDVSSLMVAAAKAAASLFAPATTAFIDVPAPTVEVLQ
jgi:hypothetical protein